MEFPYFSFTATPRLTMDAAPLHDFSAPSEKPRAMDAFPWMAEVLLQTGATSLTVTHHFDPASRPGCIRSLLATLHYENATLGSRACRITFVEDEAIAWAHIHTWRMLDAEARRGKTPVFVYGVCHYSLADDRPTKAFFYVTLDVGTPMCNVTPKMRHMNWKDIVACLLDHLRAYNACVSTPSSESCLFFYGFVSEVDFEVVDDFQFRMVHPPRGSLLVKMGTYGVTGVSSQLGDIQSVHDEIVNILSTLFSIALKLFGVSVDLNLNHCTKSDTSLPQLAVEFMRFLRGDAVILGGGNRDVASMASLLAWIRHIAKSDVLEESPIVSTAKGPNLNLQDEPNLKEVSTASPPPSVIPSVPNKSVLIGLYDVDFQSETIELLPNVGASVSARASSSSVENDTGRRLENKNNVSDISFVNESWQRAGLGARAPFFGNDVNYGTIHKPVFRCWFRMPDGVTVWSDGTSKQSAKEAVARPVVAWITRGGLSQHAK
jgi:hypothetical protein